MKSINAPLFNILRPNNPLFEYTHNEFLKIIQEKRERGKGIKVIYFS